MPIPAPTFHPRDRVLVARKNRATEQLRYQFRDANWRLLKIETRRARLRTGARITTGDGRRRRIVAFALTHDEQTWDVLTAPDPRKAG